MTQAIIPMNLQALRVNTNDAGLLTPKYKGRTALFEEMPYQPTDTVASTGEAIIQPLEEVATPANPLSAGIHLHWELPDLYKRGHQSTDGSDPVFPHAPNMWLVIRYLRIWDAQAKAYGPLSTYGWVVESDFISDKLHKDATGVERPAISVPLPPQPKPGDVPFRYMGRVVDLSQWTGPATPEHYLPHYAPNYLTAIGFVGPSFASYYPECSSVFGFWDHFGDEPAIAKAIAANTPVQFMASYQVIGWIRDSKNDVLADLTSKVTKAYDSYVAASKTEKTAITRTPAEDLERIAEETYRISVNTADIHYELNPDKTLRSLTAPTQGLCNGILQEVVWNMETAPGSTYFLNNPEGPQPNPVWSDDQIRMAVGNTTAEGLAALIKDDIVNPRAGAKAVKDYEVLLDALQLGLLHDLEKSGNALVRLEEDLHSRSFAKVAGGYVWTVEPKDEAGKTPDTAPDSNKEVTLPLPLAEVLTALNRAQKSYDQGRAALDEMRKQLFMDWLRFIADYVNPAGGKLHVKLDTLVDFIDNQTAHCELGFVVDQGKAVGLLSYTQDPVSGQVAGIDPVSSLTSSAGKVWSAYQDLVTALAGHPEWQIRATPAPAFWTPTDPVLVMEGDRLQPVRRNGDAQNTPVRLTSELLSDLALDYKGSKLSVPAASIPGQPVLQGALPVLPTLTAIVSEAFLLVPMLAEELADALAKQGGSANPAVDDKAAFVTSLNAAQGGLSPLQAHPQGNDGLYARLHKDGAVPLENAEQDVAAPQAIKFTFTNSAAIGWTPYGPGWSAQTAVPELAPHRVDPFLPVFMIWSGTLDPMARDAVQNYQSDSLTAHFGLDPNAVDYTYDPAGPPITTGDPVSYGGSVVLSRQPTKSLTAQIDQYEEFYPQSPAKAQLETAKAAYDKRHIVSQGVGGLNREQTLRTTIARVPVEDLVTGDREMVTSRINDAARADQRDDWYRFGFNSVRPIPQGPMAQGNFGPFRSGFATIRDLEIVDAFGQRMVLNTKGKHPSGAQRAIPSHTLAPAEGDTAHAEDIFFPPRMLPPTRLWFKWLSALHDSKIKGFDQDFAEMNAHPATSPVCGWVLPNHLDRSLFFYDSDGTALGAFGLEHGDTVYRAPAGDLSDNLASIIGPQQGPPLVNPHVFDFMWYMNAQSGDFLYDMMQAIQGSEGFMAPASFAQSVSLSVLMGRPLAITRAVMGLETLGGVLPVSQADTSSNAAFSADVTAGRYVYADRQAASSANLSAVEVPVRLGNLTNIDDGLVGFLIDGQGGTGPYGTFYAPAAPDPGEHGVERPAADTLSLKLNSNQISVTVLMDPRGPIHATTGILPVEQLQIPPDQYAQAMARLELTFFTHPVLLGRAGLTLPLPEEAGYAWSWVTPGSDTPTPLAAKAGNDVAVYNYTPQHLLEGWTRLFKAPKPGTAVNEPEDEA